MSWEKVPSLFRMPEVPGWTPPDSMWRGKGADSGLFAFYDYPWGGYLIVKKEDLAFSLKIGSSVFTPVFTDVNGRIYWQGSGYVYWSRVCQTWIWTQMFPGYEPVESYTFEEDGTVWSGDGFWSFERPPSGPGVEIELTPRGSYTGKRDPIAMTAVWPRWVSQTEIGVYTGADGREGEKSMGIPRFTDGTEIFERSLEREDGHFTYGRIRFKSGKWVIGTPGADEGWREGEEPSRSGSVTFRFCRNEGSDAEGSDMTVSFKDLVKGSAKSTAFLGSVAVWR